MKKRFCLIERRFSQTDDLTAGFGREPIISTENTNDDTKDGTIKNGANAKKCEKIILLAPAAADK